MQIDLKDVSSAHWQSVPAREIYPGVRKRALWQGPAGAKAAILGIDANTAFPELDVHHPGPEEVFVVSGTFNDGVHDYPAGSFIHNPASCSTAPVSRLSRFFPRPGC